MALGSENAIILLTNYEMRCNIVKAIPKRSDPGVLVSYGRLEPKKKTEGSSVNPSFMDAILKCKQDGKLDSPPYCPTEWKNWISIHAKPSSDMEQIEVCVEVLDEFLKSLCIISRNPLLYLHGKLEVGLDNNLPWSPFYSKTVGKCLRVSDVLMSKQSQQTPHPSHWNTSVPLSTFKPWETWEIKFKLDVAVEWLDGFPLEIEIGSANEVLKSLYENDATKDLTICVGNGVEVKCHSIILGAHSSAFTAMLSPAIGMKEAQTRRIEMKDISEDAMIELLRYLYGMKISMPGLNCDVALQLFQFADKYKLPKLEDACTQLLLAKSEDWFTPNVILELYCYAKNLEIFSKLREHALRIMARIHEEVRSCERFQELDSAEAVDMAWKLLQFK